MIKISQSREGWWSVYIHPYWRGEYSFEDAIEISSRAVNARL